MTRQPRYQAGRRTVFERILIAIDGSEPSERAAAFGAQLAARLGARVALVHVVDPAPTSAPDGGVFPEDLLDDLRHEGWELLRRTASQVPAGTPVETFLRIGQPAGEPLATAWDWRAELIAMGTHGRTGIVRLWIGGTAETVVERAEQPLMTVRSGDP